MSFVHSAGWSPPTRMREAKGNDPFSPARPLSLQALTFQPATKESRTRREAAARSLAAAQERRKISTGLLEWCRRAALPHATGSSKAALRVSELEIAMASLRLSCWAQAAARLVLNQAARRWQLHAEYRALIWIRRVTTSQLMDISTYKKAARWRKHHGRRFFLRAGWEALRRWTPPSRYEQ